MVEQNLRIVMKQQRTKDCVGLVPRAVLTMNFRGALLQVSPPTSCFMEDDLLGSSKPPFLRTSRGPLGIGWNTSSLWLSRLGLS